MQSMKESFDTVKDALEWGVRRLNEGKIEEAEAEAEFLLTGLLEIKRHELFTGGLKALAPAEADRFASFISRRLAREPAQYITGKASFMGLDLKVTPATLIPRPETEGLVEIALKSAAALTLTIEGEPVIIDLCTGCGCIAIAMARNLPGCRIYATDLSAEALDVARENVATHGVERRIKLLQGDLYEALKGAALNSKAGLILANPPYITEEDMGTLAPEVAEHEPASALYGGVSGLESIRRIIEGAGEWLSPGGSLIMEVGYDQGATVPGLVMATGDFEEARMATDLAGIERVLIAKKRS